MTGPIPTRRQLLKSGVVTLAAGGLLGTASAHDDHGGSPVPEALVGGFQVKPFGPVRLPTALKFGPGDDLYVASIPRSGYEHLLLPEDVADEVRSATGGNATVERLHVEFTPAGPAVTGTTTVVTGFDMPLGLAFDEGGALYVADNRQAIDDDQVTRTKATISRVADVDGTGEAEMVIDGVPSGPIHDANHVELGPQGRLHFAVGSTSCNGQNHGREILPYTGSVLRVDVDDVVGSPAVLHWTDESGAPIEPDAAEWDNVNRQIAQHPVNDDFNDKVEVVARGFRNIFGIAFGPDDVLYTGMNGSQGPASQDVFYRLDEIDASGVPDGNDDRRLDEFAGVPHYGFPYALNFADDEDGGVGRESHGFQLEANPVYDGTGAEIDPADYVAADGLMGWHVCATGLDFPTEGRYAFPEEVHGDAYIAECGSYEAQTTVDRTAAAGDTRNAGHKVTRVDLAADGSVEGYQDWLTGFSSPTDVEFGPEGAMYVADLDNGVIVAHPVPGSNEIEVL